MQNLLKQSLHSMTTARKMKEQTCAPLTDKLGSLAQDQQADHDKVSEIDLTRGVSLVPGNSYSYLAGPFLM